MEGRQQLGLDAFEQVAREDQVVVTQGQDVGLVRAVGGGSQPEQKRWGEVPEQATVGCRSSVMKLVDHDVVEVLRCKALEVCGPCQRLDGGAQHVHLGVVTLTHVEPDPALGSDPNEGLRRLVQDLFAMCHEENAARTHTR